MVVDTGFIVVVVGVLVVGALVVGFTVVTAFVVVGAGGKVVGPSGVVPVGPAVVPLKLISIIVATHHFFGILVSLMCLVYC